MLCDELALRMTKVIEASALTFLFGQRTQSCRYWLNADRYDQFMKIPIIVDNRFLEGIDNAFGIKARQLRLTKHAGRQ